MVRAIKCAPDELFIDGREIYINFPNGAGRPTLSWATIPKMLKSFGDGAELEQRQEDVGDGGKDGSGEVSVRIRGWRLGAPG